MARKIINIDELIGDPLILRVGGVDYPVSEVSAEEYFRMVKLEDEAKAQGLAGKTEVIIEQARRLLPTYPWEEKPIPIAAVFALVQEVSTELGELQRARMPSKPPTKPVKRVK